MEANSNGYNGWYCAHCRCGVDPSEVTYHETHTVCGRYITDDEPPKGLTDLEIVQKAFECASLYHIKPDNPNQYFCLNNYESLLTWAKQTIEGVE